MLLNVLHGILRILDHIMEQSGAYGCGAEPYLLTGDLGHGDRMEYVRFARTPPDTLVGLFGKSESPLYYLDFLSVVARKIAGEHILKLGFDQTVLLFGRELIAYGR
jgi:hypothetical protein